MKPKIKEVRHKIATITIHAIKNEIRKGNSTEYKLKGYRIEIDRAVDSISFYIDKKKKADVVSEIYKELYL